MKNKKIMKIIRKYPKRSKFSNFYIRVDFESEWNDNDEEIVNLVYKIKGTDKKISGYQTIDNNKTLVYFGNKEKCISKEDELLLKQKDFEKEGFLEKQKHKKNTIINKYKLLLEEDLRKNDEYYEQEIKNNDLFWDDYPNSIYGNSGYYDGIDIIIKQAKRKEKIKKLIYEKNK